MQTAIHIENLGKTYPLYDHPADRVKEALHPMRRKYHRDFHALEHLDLTIEKGETVGIIGRNGAGKSTLLKLITGVLNPSYGMIHVKGKVSALLELGAGFNPEMTGWENAYFSGSLMGYSKEEMDERIKQITQFADIGPFLDQPVKKYSSGMFARLAFAVAINVDPDILIVDEALSVGDLNFQARCFAKFKEFQAGGKTILFVTHSLDSIIRYCNRGVLLDRGKKITEGNPKDVVDLYKQLLTQNESGIPSTTEQELQNPDHSFRFKDHFQINPDLLKYGDDQAEIIDFGIFDQQNKPSQKLFFGDPYSIKMRIRFNTAMNQPIFAFTIKDLKGLEITGTNTHFEHVDTGTFQPGGTVIIEFRQTMHLQSGGYSLSLGCTRYTADDFVVHSRLYDCLLFEVISHKHMVGFFDPQSAISIREEGI